jgi:hypothetical protein
MLQYTAALLEVIALAKPTPPAAAVLPIEIAVAVVNGWLNNTLGTVEHD